MRKVIKIVIILGSIMFLFTWLTSCKTTEIVTEKEFVTVYDTIKIEKKVIDTIEIKSEIEKIREIKSNVFLPCPKEGEKGNSGRNESGDNFADWKYDVEKGGYNVELYCAEQINQKDSINKRLTIENSMLKIHSSIKVSESTKETTTEKSHWWQSLLKNVWKVLFFVVAILWVFGITPKFIIKKLI